VAHQTAQVPLLISFSGMDGSGKTTQITGLLEAFHAAGVRTTLLAFWDNVVVAAKYREGFVHQIFKSERGIGAPGKPVNRRDKNVRGWHLSLARHFLYLLDAIHLRLVVARERRRSGIQVIVLDRYIYDELVNLNLRNPLSRAFVQLVHHLVPRPGVAYLLDADPAAAFARKPEYPVAFMRQCRQAYFDLAAQLGNMTVVPAMSLSHAKLEVLRAVEAHLRSEDSRQTLEFGGSVG
jgi:thymidylate kinase